MKLLYTLPYFVLSIVSGPLVAIAGAPFRPDAPVLILARPWSGGAKAVVHRAGGWLVGPVPTLLGAIATGEGADFDLRLRQSGAWLVLDGSRLAVLCAGAAE